MEEQFGWGRRSKFPVRFVFAPSQWLLKPSKKSVDWNQPVAILVNEINQNQPQATRNESTTKY